MKYCQKCGKEIMDEAVICPHCRCISTDETNEQQVIESSDNQPKNKKKFNKKSLRILIPIAVLIMFIIILTVVLLLFSRSNQSTLPAETYSSDESIVSEIPEESQKHTIPSYILDNALSNCKYYNNPFSISLGKLVNAAMDGYQITYLSGEDAIKKGYLKKSQIGSSVDLDYLYYAIISGDTMLNPNIPYLTEYESEAAKVWMLFDENDQLINYDVMLCDNLSTCALLVMSS